MRLLPKPEFEVFLRSCTPLYSIDVLEENMKNRVQRIVDDLLNFAPHQDPIENLQEFLKKDENFLGILLALTNLSQEKFLRILTAKRFAENDYGSEWNKDRVFTKLRQEPEFSREIAKLFIEGKENDLLKEHVVAFFLDQLSLPTDWSDLIKDQNVVGNIVRKKLAGEYSDLKGEFIERMIREKLDNLGETYGLTYEHGQVEFMALGKEVDFAIPYLANPYICIMVSYMETTASGQTARANEQNEMNEKIIHRNNRYNEHRKFVNIMDGAGWIARRSDMRKMFNGCDYCLNLNSLDQLEPIICQYVPKEFFTIREPPEIEA